MDTKITMIKLSQLLSADTGMTQRQCEEFLRTMFQQIAANIERGEAVKIKGFGSFKLTKVDSRKSVDVTTGNENEIPAHRKIVFVPAKELASAVNAPFEMFETVVLDENVLEEELMQAEASGNEVLAESIEEQIMLEEKKEDELRDEYEKSNIESEKPKQEEKIERPSKTDAEIAVGTPVVAKQDDSPETEVVDKKEQPDKSNTEDRNIDKVDKDEDKSEESSDESIESKKGSRRWWIYIAIALVCLIGGGVALWFLNDDFSARTRHLLGLEQETQAKEDQMDSTALLISSEGSDIEEAEDGVDGVVEDVPTEDMSKAEESDTRDVVPTKASDEPVYDTVSTTRYLSTIAKEHYGNFNLWPYIYKENEKILGHPNRIKPGTKVVVPDLAKYGVDPKNKADIEKAKKMGIEIYSRYK